MSYRLIRDLFLCFGLEFYLSYCEQKFKSAVTLWSIRNGNEFISTWISISDQNLAGPSSSFSGRCKLYSQLWLVPSFAILTGLKTKRLNLKYLPSRKSQLDTAEFFQHSAVFSLPTVRQTLLQSWGHSGDMPIVIQSQLRSRISNQQRPNHVRQYTTCFSGKDSI